MTRGKFGIISKNERDNLLLSCSVEFNGDMYPDGNSNGADAISLLLSEKPSNERDLLKIVKSFTKEYFSFYLDDLYDTDLIDTCSIPKNRHGEYTLDFTDYYKKDYGFSDYIYLFNSTGENIVIVCSDGSLYTFKPNTFMGLYFGKYSTESTQSGISLASGLVPYDILGLEGINAGGKVLIKK